VWRQQGYIEIGREMFVGLVSKMNQVDMSINRKGQLDGCARRGLSCDHVLDRHRSDILGKKNLPNLVNGHEELSRALIVGLG
jgi:hypothetical protein